MYQRLKWFIFAGILAGFALFNLAATEEDRGDGVSPLVAGILITALVVGICILGFLFAFIMAAGTDKKGKR